MSSTGSPARLSELIAALSLAERATDLVGGFQAWKRFSAQAQVDPVEADPTPFAVVSLCVLRRWMPRRARVSGSRRAVWRKY